MKQFLQLDKYVCVYWIMMTKCISYTHGIPVYSGKRVVFGVRYTSVSNPRSALLLCVLGQVTK